MKAFEMIRFVLRLSGMLVWLVISSFIGFAISVFRWGDPNNTYRYGRIYGPIARWIMGMRTPVQGLEHQTSAQPCIYVVNHQSGVDMTAMAEVYPPRTILIGKKELLYIPFWGLMYLAFGNIVIDRGDRSHAFAGLKKAVDAVRTKGVSIWIFPEGTRNRTGVGLLPFKKGAFYMAIEAQVPIVPIVCASLNPLISFPKRYARSGTVQLRVLPPISTVGKTAADLPALLAETHAKMLAALEDLNRA